MTANIKEKYKVIYLYKPVVRLISEVIIDQPLT